MNQSRELQRASASRTEMSARSHRSAPRAVARLAGIRINGPVFGGASPNHCGNPADHRPTNQEIQYENPRELPLLVPDNRRQEIQQRDGQEKHHGPPPSTLYYGSGRQFVPSVLTLSGLSMPCPPNIFAGFVPSSRFCD